MKHQISDINTPHIISKRLFLIGIKRNMIIAVTLAILSLSILFITLFLFNPLKITIKGASYYALVLQSFDSVSNANQFKEEITKIGASGYIISGGEHNVLASIYKNKNDAKIVLDRYNTDYPHAFIKKIKIKRMSVNKLKNKGDDTKLKQILLEGGQLIDDLILLSNNLDTLNSNENQTLYSLNQYKIRLIENRDNLKKMLIDYPTNSTLIKALAFYESVINQIDYALSIEDTFLNLNHRIKYFYCFTLNALANLSYQM